MYRLRIVEPGTDRSDASIVRTARTRQGAREQAKTWLRGEPEWEGEPLYCWMHPDTGAELWEWDPDGPAVEITRS